MNDSTDRRLSMVNGQILPNKVTDLRITDAMLAVPRESFVPKALRGVAYVDEDIPLGNGRYLMEPVVFARMLQAAEIEADDLVLDIGGATGYAAAVIAHLASAVVALECDDVLARKANENLAGLEIDNVAVVTGELDQGYPEQGPYNVIFLDGAVERVPEALTGQLADKGRMVLVSRRHGVGKAMLYRNFDGMTSARELFDAQVFQLPGFAIKPGFVF